MVRGKDKTNTLLDTKEDIFMSDRVPVSEFLEGPGPVTIRTR